MRLKSLALASMVPAFLAIAPRVTDAQRTRIRCRDASACIVDDDIARTTRERAIRIREEALDRARFAREEARARSAAVRADVRRSERDASRLAQLRAVDRARENAFRARRRADERRDRAEERRDRARELREDRRYDPPGRYRIRW